MPALAGSARMPYPRFLAFNAAGGVLWGTAVVLIGYLAGRSYATVERAFGWGAAAVVALVVVTALVAWRVRKSRVAPVRTGETGPEPRAGDGMPRT
jgi:membrane protein DedA with SNARE-associated domain